MNFNWPALSCMSYVLIWWTMGSTKCELLPYRARTRRIMIRTYILSVKTNACLQTYSCQWQMNKRLTCTLQMFLIVTGQYVLQNLIIWLSWCAVRIRMISPARTWNMITRRPCCRCWLFRLASATERNSNSAKYSNRTASMSEWMDINVSRKHFRPVRWCTRISSIGSATLINGGRLSGDVSRCRWLSWIFGS